ncbi:glycosyltransferase family 2 protein [Roseateles sp.]|uniref:glycosyltransferase family 2 protein n=1 Tax=Roseateles sp. TaxID=1971397 RepID=UPI0031E3C9FD
MPGSHASSARRLTASVVFTTYNQPEWLHKVLLGFATQTRSDFELIVADDGSGPETRAVVESMRGSLRVEVQHLWQADEGFRKCAILNKALCAARAPYVIVTDGDCIPRADFVDTHLRHRAPGRFLSGGYFKLSMSLSRAIAPADITSGRCFELAWLRAHGLPSDLRSRTRLGMGRFGAAVLDRVMQARTTWNGHNASGWMKDLRAVNGFDERMGYGGEDVELGERLQRIGVTGKRIRYRAPVLHLDHPRAYDQPEVRAINEAIRARGRDEQSIWTPHGIEKREA